jgi:hypothetical protein
MLRVSQQFSRIFSYSDVFAAARCNMPATYAARLHSAVQTAQGAGCL